MKYGDFSVNDFVTDEYFQYWVAHPGDREAAGFWDNFLQAHAHKRDEVEEARAILESIRFSNHTLSNEDLSQLWARIRHIDQARAQRSRDTRRPVWYAAAAVALLLVVAGVLYVNLRSTAWRTYATAYGETKTIVLPDSSRVILNANSTLRILDNWDDKPGREIWLDGEAYFSVVHTADNKPFSVRTADGLSVDVLGTTFNVYNRTEKTTVILNTGKIRLNLPPDSYQRDDAHQHNGVAAEAYRQIEMKPGDKVDYKERQFKKEAVDPRLYTAWTQNKIILNHTSLRDMVGMLTDTYGLDVHVASDDLLDETVSGSMPLGNAEVLLQQMAKAFRLKITRNENEIYMEEQVY